MSDTASRSSQDVRAALDATSAPDDAIAPPRVPSTARRRSLPHKREVTDEWKASASLVSGRDRTPSRLPSPPQHGHLTSSQGDGESHATPRRRKRLNSASASAFSAAALRQRLRSSMVATAEAEAVRAAREFSLQMYHELHHRKFASVHEELDFLRRDFVASRRTLALLHEDNVRLARELLSRVQEVEELHVKLEEAYRAEDEGTAAPVSSSLPSSRRVSLIQSSRRIAGGTPLQRDAYDLPVLWALTASDEEKGEKASKGTSPAETSSEHKGAAEQQSKSEDTKNEAQTEAGISTAIDRPGPSPSSAPSPSGINSSTSPANSLRSQPARTKSTPLAFYAHTAGRKHVHHPSTDEGEANLHDLIRDLRANLARRDTALYEAQLELSAVQHERQQLQRELTDVQAQLLLAKQQRDALQCNVTALEEQMAAQEKEKEASQRQVEQLSKERDDLQRRLITAELLYEYTGPRGEGSGGASLKSGVSGEVSPSPAASPEHYLRDQLQMYRSKWQAAEDEVEHLNQRLSQLQRQLVRYGTTDTATAALSHPSSSPRPLEEKAEDKLNRATDAAAMLEITAQQQAEHAAELEGLRRQHREQLQLHAEEVQRLQRRLDRAQENAAFHEDQLRQQRQDDARQHHGEVQALQSQLRTAQGELVKAQQDREHLARQLRRSTEQETTVEVLRGQVDQLKQRLGEVGAEQAELRGRLKEATLQLQRERMARAAAEHDAERAGEEARRLTKEVAYLQEEIVLLREQLGGQEASTSSGKVRKSSAPSSPEDASTAGRRGRNASAAALNAATVADGGDAATLASELKGYVSLMRVNTTLQQRIEELEAQVSSLQAAPDAENPAAPSALLSTRPAALQPPSNTAPLVTHSEAALTLEVERLTRELELSRQVQQELLSSGVTAEKERRLLADDNVTLANGIEVLERQLLKVQAARQAEQARSRQRESSLRRHLSRQRSREETEEKRASKRRKAKHIKAKEDGAGLHTSPLRELPSPSEESRLRQKLQTARAQDQSVATDDLQKRSNTSPSAQHMKECSRRCSCGVLTNCLCAHPSCRCCCSPSRCCQPSIGCCGQASNSTTVSPFSPAPCRHHDADAPLPPAPMPPPFPSGNRAESAHDTATPAVSVAPTDTLASSTPAAAPPPSRTSQAAAASSPSSLQPAPADETRPVAVQTTSGNALTTLVITAAATTAAEAAAPAETSLSVHARRDASSSPLHSPRRHVRGSVLPPVFYPPLVLKSRA